MTKHASYKDARIRELLIESESKTRMLDGLLKENMRLRKIIIDGGLKV